MREASRREHPPIRLSSLLVLSGSAAAVASVLLFALLWALLTAAALRRETAAVREQSIQDSQATICAPARRPRDKPYRPEELLARVRQLLGKPA